MNSVEIEWNDPDEFPGVLNEAGKNFSCDVFVYCESTDENTIGWFDFTNMTWSFLCREPIGKNWKWRHLNNKIDKYK